jgi:hypothetical protein
MSTTRSGKVATDFMVKGGLDLAYESFAERDPARHNILNKQLTLFLTDS